MNPAASVVILLGAFLVVLSAIGVVRLPDVYARMHAATKTATLGIVLLFLGAAISMDDRLAATKFVIAAAVQLIAAPAAAHALGRATYGAQVEMREETRRFGLDDDTEG